MAGAPARDTGASGLSSLSWEEGELRLIDIGREKEKLRDRLNYSLGREFSTRDRKAHGFAVDAPTIIPNATGMRLPDKLSHKHFGRPRDAQERILYQVTLINHS